MLFRSLMATVTTISNVASALLTTITVGKELYSLALSAMDAINSNLTLSGTSKKEWVMSFLKQFVDNWDSVSAAISAFIDTAKSLYNSVIALKTAAAS